MLKFEFTNPSCRIIRGLCNKKTKLQLNMVSNIFYSGMIDSSVQRRDILSKILLQI